MIKVLMALFREPAGKRVTGVMIFLVAQFSGE
jgi:hypothetical protein